MVTSDWFCGGRSHLILTWLHSNWFSRRIYMRNIVYYNIILFICFMQVSDSVDWCFKVSLGRHLLVIWTVFGTTVSKVRSEVSYSCWFSQSCVSWRQLCLSLQLSPHPYGKSPLRFTYSQHKGEMCKTWWYRSNKGSKFPTNLPCFWFHFYAGVPMW